MPETTSDSLSKQITDALDAATHENGYPHEFHRPSEEIVAEIDEQSGIEGYNPSNSVHTFICVLAVQNWRKAQREDPEHG